MGFDRYGVTRRALITAALSAMVASLQAGAAEPPLSEDAFWGEMPVVMSATRMSQPVADAPVAVTVIDRRMIDASGAREIAELFRLVPGFIVGYHDGHTPSVAYHMSDERYSRRMQVLIDGRAVYTTAIGDVPWSTQDITMDDIDHIEVVRGPNSASYGANSFLGVINIITRPALLDHGATSVKINQGNLGVREVFLRHGGGAGKLDYRISAGYTEDDGFRDRYDEKQTSMLSLRADYTLSPIDMLTFSTGMGRGPRKVENRYVPTLSVNREKRELNHNQNIRWERTLGEGESLTVQFYHIFNGNYERFHTGPFMLADGFRLDPNLNYVDFDRRTNRYDLSLQHNTTLGSGVRTAWGGGVRRDEVWGAVNMMGDKTLNNDLKYGFMNLEWDSQKSWLVNAGAMVEDYSTTGTNVSPRLGVNYRVAPGQSLRLTVSKAIRTPSMFEYATDYGIRNAATNVFDGTNWVAGDPIDLLFWGGTRHTRVEKITSHELGYHLASNHDSSFFDIKLYRDDLRDLIFKADGGDSGYMDLFLNVYDVVIRGAELESRLMLTGRSSLYLGYAYTQMYDSVTHQKWYMAPRHSANLLYMVDFDGGYSAGAGFYFTGTIQGWETDPADEVFRSPVRRLDLKVARKFDFDGHETEVALSARNVLGKYEEMEVLRPKADFPHLNEVGASAYLTVKLQL